MGSRIKHGRTGDEVAKAKVSEEYHIQKPIIGPGHGGEMHSTAGELAVGNVDGIGDHAFLLIINRQSYVIVTPVQKSAECGPIKSEGAADSLAYPGIVDPDHDRPAHTETGDIVEIADDRLAIKAGKGYPPNIYAAGPPPFQYPNGIGQIIAYVKSFAEVTAGAAADKTQFRRRVDRGILVEKTVDHVVDCSIPADNDDTGGPALKCFTGQRDGITRAGRQGKPMVGEFRLEGVLHGRPLVAGFAIG